MDITPLAILNQHFVNIFGHAPLAFVLSNYFNSRTLPSETTLG